MSVVSEGVCVVSEGVGVVSEGVVSEGVRECG